MSTREIGVALLGYGTVGAAVDRVLHEQGDRIEGATGHRLRVVRALVRDLAKERDFTPEPGVLTADFARIRDDPSVRVVAEVMGGTEPACGYLLELLRAGKAVVTANKQLVARNGAELFAAASESGVQVRFEAAVCAAVPVIKVLRESLVASDVRRIQAIVNGTTNFVLEEMERGSTYAEAIAEAQLLGYAEADPADDVSGADAAAKMAILATTAFGSRVTVDDVDFDGIEGITKAHLDGARALGMAVRLVGTATRFDDAVAVRVRPSVLDREHPLAAVEGAFNAVVLHGDAIGEVTLQGPGAGGLETASAVVADLVAVAGTSGSGFLRNDPCRRRLALLAPDSFAARSYVHLELADQSGAAMQMTTALAANGVFVERQARLTDRDGADLHLLTRPVRERDLHAALARLEALPAVRGSVAALPVVGDVAVPAPETRAQAR